VTLLSFKINLKRFFRTESLNEDRLFSQVRLKGPPPVELRVSWEFLESPGQWTLFERDDGNRLTQSVRNGVKFGVLQNGLEVDFGSFVLSGSGKAVRWVPADFVLTIAATSPNVELDNLLDYNDTAKPTEISGKNCNAGFAELKIRRFANCGSLLNLVASGSAFCWVEGKDLFAAGDSNHLVLVEHAVKTKTALNCDRDPVVPQDNRYKGMRSHCAVLFGGRRLAWTLLQAPALIKEYLKGPTIETHARADESIVLEWKGAAAEQIAALRDIGVRLDKLMAMEKHGVTYFEERMNRSVRGLKAKLGAVFVHQGF
jgi:hypothetical protein